MGFNLALSYYESYLGRNEALAIDVYDNVVNLARPRLAFFSAAETTWFGLEHLNLGYHDFTRLPDASDGVWLKPFEEGKPGIQPERIPPYVCTFNPGWDPGLPLYKPLPLFEAQKAAQASDGPLPGPWDHRPEIARPDVPEIPATIDRVAFAGSRDGELFGRLTTLGLPLASAADIKSPRLLVVDAETLTDAMLPEAQSFAEATIANEGTVLVMFRKNGGVPPAVARLLPAPVTLTARSATALGRVSDHVWTAGLGLPDLYFAEDTTDKNIIKCGMDGPLVERGRVLLRTSDTDWSLFNEAPENAKCAAVILYEKLARPGAAALVEMSSGGGSVIASSIDVVPSSRANTSLWRKLFSRAGVRIGLSAMRWLVPVGVNGKPGATWRYTLDAPAEDWMQPNFDDHAWQNGVAGFGSAGVLNATSQTAWETPDIWMRTAFDLGENEPTNLMLTVYHDEDVEIYLNGLMALRRPGHVTQYETFELPREAARALKPRHNVLAVRCRQTAGAQFVDVGLGWPAISAEKDDKPHDLLLDGPPDNQP